MCIVLMWPLIAASFKADFSLSTLYINILEGNAEFQHAHWVFGKDKYLILSEMGIIWWGGIRGSIGNQLGSRV